MPHQGRNVKRLREMLGIKQEALASDLGLSQQAVSQLEQKEALDAALLKNIAEALKVPQAAIENMAEDTAFNIIGNTFTDSEFALALYNSNNTDCAFNVNPLEKLIEIIDENKRLYEQLRENDQKQIALLTSLLEKK